MHKDDTKNEFFIYLFELLNVSDRHEIACTWYINIHRQKKMKDKFQ